jgi:hypothetical protein
MKNDLQQHIVAEIGEVARSENYRRRLATIHKHYPNLKCEGRYRDALLELFNDRQEACRSGLRAYAEAKKHDLVVTQEDAGEEGWLRVELKFHFTFDVAHRVKRALAGCNEVLAVPENGRGDLNAIVRDCLHKKSSGHRADVFILIVQDRFGSAKFYGPPKQAGAKRPAYHAVLERGVPIHFLNEQIKLEHLHETAEAYHWGWRLPLYGMLKAIHGERPYRLAQSIIHTVEPVREVPLSSHIFLLDFTERGALPGIEGVFPGPAPVQAR